MSFFICSTAYASDMPLTNLSGKQIASLLNSAEMQSKLSRNFGRLSDFKFLEYKNGRNVYTATIEGGTLVNGHFFIKEDTNGKLYDIACIYNMNDVGMQKKCINIISFYLVCAGIDDKIASNILTNIKFGYNDAISQVYVPSLGGFLTMVGGVKRELPDHMLLVFSVESRHF